MPSRYYVFDSSATCRMERLGQVGPQKSFWSASLDGWPLDRRKKIVANKKEPSFFTESFAAIEFVVESRSAVKLVLGKPSRAFKAVLNCVVFAWLGLAEILGQDMLRMTRWWRFPQWLWSKLLQGEEYSDVDSMLTRGYGGSHSSASLDLGSERT
jgi:hypothetical protein